MKIYLRENLSNEEFIDKSDKEIFMEYLNDPSMILMEMANIRGIDMVIERSLPFSFFFTSKKAVHERHGIRLKVLWNPSKNPENADGYIELHGNYDYISGSHKYKPTNKELAILRDFAHKYKILFTAVWEGKLYDGYLQDYFKGRLSFKNILTKFENISERHFYLINHCKTVEELYQCVKQYHIFNLNE